MFSGLGLSPVRLSAVSEEDGGKPEAEVATSSRVQETDLGQLDDVKEPADQREAGLMQVEVEMHEQWQQHRGSRARIIIPGSKETDI